MAIVKTMSSPPEIKPIQRKSRSLDNLGSSSFQEDCDQSQHSLQRKKVDQMIEQIDKEQ